MVDEFISYLWVTFPCFLGNFLFAHADIRLLEDASSKKRGVLRFSLLRLLQIKWSVEYFIVSSVKLCPKNVQIQSGKQSYCYHYYICGNCSYFDTPNALSWHIYHMSKNSCVSLLLYTRCNKAAVTRLIPDSCFTKSAYNQFTFIETPF